MESEGAPVTVGEIHPGKALSSGLGPTKEDNTSGLEKGNMEEKEPRGISSLLVNQRLEGPDGSNKNLEKPKGKKRVFRTWNSNEGQRKKWKRLARNEPIKSRDIINETREIGEKRKAGE